MSWITLLGRLCLVRIRMVVYLVFILSTMTMFYWLGGGFEKRQVNYTNIPQTAQQSSSRVAKTDVQYPPLVKRYCNYLLYNASQDPLKNAGPTNLRLHGLVVITRHGDRAPLVPFPQHLNIPRCGVWDADDADLFHRYRNDLSNAAAATGLPLDPSAATFNTFLTAPPNERCRPGHLTAVGTVQLIRLGRQLRDHYRKAWAFPSAAIDCNAMTTLYPRTFQSALAFLYGWTGGADGEMKNLPTEGGQRTSGRKCILKAAETTYFCADRWCMCPNRIDGYRRDYHQRIAAYTRTETRDKEMKSIIQKIGTILGTPTLENPTSAFDTLMGYACHRETLPCGRVEEPGAKGSTPGEKNLCIPKEWLPRLHNEAKNADMAGAKTDAAKNLFLVEAAPILTRVAQLADELLASPKSVFEYYSGHDVSLRPLLAALDMWDGVIPPYASHVVFELMEDTHRKNVDKPELYYRVLYNGDDVTHKVSASICQNSVLSRHNEDVFKLCNVDGLREFAKKFAGKAANGEVRHGEEWARLCR